MFDVLLLTEVRQYRWQWHTT